MGKVWEVVVAHPDPVGIQVLLLLNVVFFIILSVGEIRGYGFRYSKFAGSQGSTISSKLGMLIMYTPALLLCLAFLLIKLTRPSHPLFNFFSQTNPRLMIFASALCLQFLKRTLEVLFLHKYSGSMELSMSFMIASAYLSVCAVLLYAQQLSVALQPPTMDLMGYGVVVFLVGIAGNFYHHYLLARLRRAPNTPQGRYVVPQGGLFSWVVCPHYLFECIGFMGLAIIAQTTSAFIIALGIFASLGARSHNTKKWYLKKIEGFPMERKAFIPFVF